MTKMEITNVLMRYFEHYDVSAISFTDYRHMTECGRLVGNIVRGPSEVDWHRHHTTRFIGCLTVMIDSEIVKDFSFPTINPSVRAEDFLAWSSVISRHGPAARVPSDLARYAVVPKSRSSNKLRAVKSVWLLYNAVEGIPKIPCAALFFQYLIFSSIKHASSRPIFNADDIDSEVAATYRIS